MLNHPFSLSDLAITYSPGQPDKPAFVFVHGNTQNDSCGRGMIEFFQQKGHSTLSYDLPGHGNSPLTTENYSFQSLVALNRAVLDAYQLANPILCGHSLGAMIQAGTAAYLAENQPQHKPTSLILCGGLDADPVLMAKTIALPDLVAYLTEDLEQYLTQGEKLFNGQRKYDYFVNRQLDDGLVQVINLRVTQPTASRINLTTLANFNARPALVAAAIPILVLHGDAETVIPAKLIESMLQDYTDIQVGWYKQGGHNAFYQQDQQTRQFLEHYYSFICQSLTE